MRAFVPPWWLAGGHRMTIYAGLCRRECPGLPPAADRLFRVAPDTQVLARCHWQPDPAGRLTVVVLHGLDGSADAHYARGIAEKAWRLGHNAVRLNQRNCGGTEHLTPTLFHSGLTADPLAVVEELAAVDRLSRIAIVGYSLGGNLALKLAGEYGDRHPPWLRAVVAVSPVMDLASAVGAIERRVNRPYTWHFLRGLRGRVRRKAALFPDRFDVSGLDRLRSIRAFDQHVTAPAFGFAGADDYYRRASARPLVTRIRVPTLILTAADDPMVPVEPFLAHDVTANPAVRIVVTTRGGHCGFVERRDRQIDGDRYWAERTALEFVAAHGGA